MSDAFNDEMVVRASIRNGQLPFSTKAPSVVRLVRKLAEAKMTSTEILAELGIPGHRGKMVRFCQRAGIKLQHPRGPTRRRPAREILIPSRDQRPDKIGASLMAFGPPRIPFASEAGARIARRRMTSPRCCWAGCDDYTAAPGKPYCAAHLRESGAVVR